MWRVGKSYLFVRCTVLNMKKSMVFSLPNPASVVTEKNRREHILYLSLRSHNMTYEVTGLEIQS